MSDAWLDLVKIIKRGDRPATVRLVAGLGERERREVAAELGLYLAARRRSAGRWWEWQRELPPLLLAGVACLGGAAAVAEWIFRRELRLRMEDAREAGWVAELVRHRPLEWRRDLARRVVLRLRDTEDRDWRIAAALVRESGVEPPEHDPFTAAWVRTLSWPAVTDDPLFPWLAPRIFDPVGLGEAFGRAEADAVLRLIDGGHLERAAVLDGVVGRLLRDGADALTVLAGLHDRLEPGLDEAAARAGDYVAMLPVAPVPVADLAVRQVRRLEESGRLGAELFAEAVEALAFRREKKLVRAALVWVNGALTRTPERAGAGLPALAAVLRLDALDLQEHAVRVAVRHAAKADEEARAAIREAADDLPAELRARITAAYGGAPGEAETTRDADAGPGESADGAGAEAGEAACAVAAGSGAATCGPGGLHGEAASGGTAGGGLRGEAAYEGAAGGVLVAGDAPEWGPSAGSPREVAEFVDAICWPLRGDLFERVLAGLVEWNHRDPEALREALRPWRERVDEGLDLGYRLRGSCERTYELLHRVVHAAAAPQESAGLSERITRSGVEAYPEGTLEEVFRDRARELVALFESGRRYPVLLAAPTSGTGHVAADVLVERLELLEAAGVEALPADLAQALLRLPREVGPDVVERAGKLGSAAGRACAAWLDGGRMDDPEAVCAPVLKPHGHLELRVELWSGGDPPYPFPGLFDVTSLFTYSVGRWRLVLPSHREVVAAHLAPFLVNAVEAAFSPRVVPELVHGEGPLGVATGYALAAVMGHRDAGQRAAAADALVTLAARGELPAAALAEAVAALAGVGVVKLGRVVPVLDDVARRGGCAEVWEVVACLLPRLLPAAGERPRSGLADLLAMGARAAGAAGARGEIPELAAAAARKGSSRLAQEARRLHGLLTG
ncbi:hypothetical protein [Nonomuraea sp. NPDC048826]|uniref:hypothetical protein n=1 Tax=Nonomuraea sp. NPDC048826 TaxID=3364347 RepID=UPI0037224A5F